jgi:NitT/TauT family transport system substrate-binding protein
MTFRNSRLSLASLLMGALVLAACGGETASGGDASGSEADFNRPIKVGGIFDVAELPVYVAAKRGFFEEHGVPVDGDLIFTQGGSATVTALVTGDFDFGNPSLGGVVRAVEEGQGLQIVAPLFGEIWALSIRADLEGEIKSVEDLKGRTIGVTSIGSGTYNFLAGLLSQAGLNPETDVEILPLGAPGNILASLKTGGVDAAVTWEPLKTQAEGDGSIVHLVDLLDPDDHLEVLGAESSLGTVLAAGSDIVENEPEVVERVIAALMDAHEWIQSHTPEESVAVLVEAAPGESFDTAVMGKVVADYMEQFPSSLELSRTAYEASGESLVHGGVVAAYPPLDEIAACDVAKCVD